MLFYISVATFIIIDLAKYTSYSFGIGVRRDHK
jgi:hypothetical protein